MAYIDDFGQKIGGAKKDLWRQRGLLISDLDDIDLREYLEFITKDNIWPTPDYEGYLKTGMEPVCVYFMKEVRDKLQAKTEVYNDDKNKERAARYIQFIQDVKDSCEKTKTREDIKKFRKVLLIEHGYRTESNTWAPKARSTPGLEDNFLKFIQFTDTQVEDLVFETLVQNFPFEFRGDLKGLRLIKSYFDGKHYIYKGSKQLIRQGFASEEEAKEFAKTELKEVLDNKKSGAKREVKTKKVIRPQLEYIERTGPDLRKGQNATSDHILKAFKFRGGEFGNWNTQDDRQAYLNYAFDALVDLGYVLQCPLEFISFSPLGSYNGQMLAIAFGARGSGNALAHYECGRVVINLTKIRGAGCLAHEWGHAFDDFLGRKCGLKGISDFLSSTHIEVQGEYENIAHAMNNVMIAIRQKDKPNEVILEEAEKDIARSIKIMKSWVESSLRYFDTDNGGQRRKPTPEELESIRSEANKLYETGEKEHYDKFVEIYKEVKGVLPSKDTRDTSEAILRQIEHTRNSINEFKKTGEFKFKRTQDTDYYKAAKELDDNRAKPYYMTSCELFARAFESYIEDKLGFKSQYLVHSTRSNGLYGDLKPYPQGEERQTINAAIENLVKLAVEAFASEDKKLNYSMYENFDDKENKYSRERMLGGTPKKEQEQSNERGKKINNALIEIYMGYMKRVEGEQSKKALENAQDVLNALGKSYYKGHSAKYKSTNTAKDVELAQDSEVFTCIIYTGLTLFKAPIDYFELKSTIRSKITEIAKVDDCLVRIISPDLVGIEKINENDIAKYDKAIVSVAADPLVSPAIPKEIPKQEPKSVVEPVKNAKEKEISLNNIQNSEDLRKFLIEKAHEALPGSICIQPSMLYNAIAALAESQLQMGKVILGDVPSKLAQGNSKAWRIDNGSLVVAQDNNIEKQLEGLIEPIVKVLTMRKYGHTNEANMIGSAVTYMICKRLNLDVRSYCLTPEYERVAKNKTQVRAFTNVCQGAFKEIAAQLHIKDALR